MATLTNPKEVACRCRRQSNPFRVVGKKGGEKGGMEKREGSHPGDGGGKEERMISDITKQKLA